MQPKLLSSAVFAGLLSILVSGNALAFDADAAKTLAQDNKCFRCHSIDKEKDGPAWTKISAKFKAESNGQEKLLHHLTSGEIAKFPDGHEEPHKVLKTDDPAAAKNLVEWILSLN